MSGLEVARPRQCAVEDCSTLEVARGRCYRHGAPGRNVATIAAPEFVPESVTAAAKRATEATALFNRERQRQRTRTAVPARWEDAS